MKTLRCFLADEEGATVLEFALITGIIAFTAIAAMVVLGFKFMGLMVSRV